MSLVLNETLSLLNLQRPDVRANPYPFYDQLRDEDPVHWDEGLDFRSLVRGDPEISARVNLGEVFDLGVYTRHVDVVFERRPAPVPEGAPA